MPGYLEITFGPMFSGKTSNLLQKIHSYLDVHRHKRKQKNGLVINHSSDNRSLNGCGNLSTHSSMSKEMNPRLDFRSVERLSEVPYEMIKGADYIAVDESQFYEDLIPYVSAWLAMGKHVHLSGLIADSSKNSFGEMLSLFPKADHIEQLKAFCVKCKDHHMNAPFTKSKKKKRGQVLVGASDLYYPVCGEHYNW
jgi:thymidine kinase